jgi:transcription elongation factor GreA
VETGTVITAKIAGEESIFLLGNREIAAGTDYTVYSESSPMGAAILGLKVGEKTVFTAPNGKDIAVEVINVATFTG